MIYLVIFFLLIALIYHYDYRKNSLYKNWWYYILLIIFILISGLRYRLGFDTINYELGYPKLPNLSNYFLYDFEDTRYGRGFIFLVSIAKSISDEFFILQFLHAFILNVLLFNFFKKYSPYIFSCILLYYACDYLYFNFMILRESLAVVIFLYAFQFILNKKWLKYYFWCFIAILFHPSAAFVLFLPIFRFKIFNNFFSLNKTFLITSTCFFLIGIYIAAVFFDAIQLLEMEDVDNYIDRYGGSLEGEGIFGRSLKYFILIIVQVFLYPLIILFVIKKKPKLFYLLYNDGKSKEIYTKTYDYRIILCLSIYVSLISLFVPILLRFNNYLIPFVWIGLANIYIPIFKRFKTYALNKYVFSFLFIFPLLFVNIYGTFFANSQSSSIPPRIQYYPYTSILNPEKISDRETFYNDILNHRYK